MADNPAKEFGRRLRVEGKLPLEVVLMIVSANTSFRKAVEFFKMGFPLSVCMRGVGWPQNRYEAPSALFRPEPTLVEGCYGCGMMRTLCKCPMLLRQLPVNVLPLEGVADEEGAVWPYYTQSIEEGWNSETYLVQHWSDETMEWSCADALNGERVAYQLKSIRTGRVLQWKSADPFCICAHAQTAEHDAWEECPISLMDVELWLTAAEDAEIQAEV